MPPKFYPNLYVKTQNIVKLKKSCDIHASWLHTHSAYERVRARFVEHHGPAAKDRFHPFTVPVQAEFKEVCQNEIGKCGPVALELVTAFDDIEAFFRGLLGLDVSDDAVGSVPQAKVGVAGLRGLGEGGDVDMGAARGLRDLLEQARQGRIEGLLPRISPQGHVGKVLQVFFEKRLWVHDYLTTS
jgi:hypothetical protein